MKKFIIGSSMEEVKKLIPPGSIKKVMVGNQAVALTEFKGVFFAFETQCPHRGELLTKGRINPKGEIICPLHNYRFDLQHGQVRAGYCPDLKVYRTELHSQGLTVYMPEG